MKVKEFLLVLKNQDNVYLNLKDKLGCIDLCKPKNVLTYKNYIISEIEVDSIGYIYIEAAEQENEVKNDD